MSRLALRLTAAGGQAVSRRNEPITFGLPFPKGLCTDTTSRLSVVSGDGVATPRQVRVLDRWSDGSVRWALLDFAATCGSGAPGYELDVDGAAGAPAVTIQTRLDEAGASVDTGAGRFRLPSSGALVYEAAAGSRAAPVICSLALTAAGGQTLPIREGRLSMEEDGPLRCCVLLEASLGKGRRALELAVRHHFHAGTPFVRVQATVRNPSRAVHEGGFWELGDPASCYIEDFSFVVRLPERGSPWTVSASPEPWQPMRPCALPLTIYQDSSGGEQWDSPSHLNREKRLPLRFRGYRLRAGDDETPGLRATPVVRASDGSHTVAIAQRHFWQRFPKTMEATATAVRLGLLPREFGDVHELQGGEQITEEFVVSFGEDGIADVPLDWVRNPLRASAPPSWYCAAQAMPYLTPAGEGPGQAYEDLVNGAVQGSDSFFEKRERIDEYGWRNFGDLYADHETVHHPAPRPLVSHYNNQYDAAAGFACQFFRSGELRWLALMEDLARHVVDIDIYHTTQDKPVYSGGLFWHTDHHTDAGISTHRTYPRGAGRSSGGPSPEHNYNTGLMLHYFLSGDARAREAAVGLARWVIEMDDGARTPLRWLSRAPTGMASATGSGSCHGPGRGPGNGIVALLNGWRLTRERAYLDKAEELVRRCVHPAQDLAALDLLDAERRWYYTVFLQALGRYLDVKAEAAEVDDAYAYGQMTLQHYAKWMAEHEYPYLEKPDILQYPTETWAAQDMRKSEVLNVASRHAEEPQRSWFRARADFFHDTAVSTLAGMSTRMFTRPLVLMLTNGYMRGSSMLRVPAAVSRHGGVFEPPVRFVPQWTRAFRTALAIGVSGVGAAAVLYLLS